MGFRAREVVAANAALITEKRGMVNLLPPMMSTRHLPSQMEQQASAIVRCLGQACGRRGCSGEVRHSKDLKT